MSARREDAQPLADQGRADASPLKFGEDGDGGQRHGFVPLWACVYEEPAEQDVPYHDVGYLGHQREPGVAAVPQGVDEVSLFGRPEGQPVDPLDGSPVGGSLRAD